MTIKELRSLTGLSQSKFASKYKLNLGTMKEWEQERCRTPECVLYLLERIIREVDYREDLKND